MRQAIVVLFSCMFFSALLCAQDKDLNDDTAEFQPSPDLPSKVNEPDENYKLDSDDDSDFGSSNGEFDDSNNSREDTNVSTFGDDSPALFEAPAPVSDDLYQDDYQSAF